MERTTTAPFHEHISTSDNNQGFAAPLRAFFLPCCIHQSYTTSQRGIKGSEWTLNGGKMMCFPKELLNMEECLLRASMFSVLIK